MEHLLEQPDDLLAYRLRADAGGETMPRGPELTVLDPDAFPRMRTDVEPLRASLPVFVLP